MGSNTHFTPTSCERHLLQEDLMTLRSDRHLATLCSSTALLLRGRLVDKAPGARLLIKARALHSAAHRRSRIYGRNRIPHSNTLTGTCSAGSIYAGAKEIRTAGPLYVGSPVAKGAIERSSRPLLDARKLANKPLSIATRK